MAQNACEFHKVFCKNIIVKMLYVTGFGKTCIVHTSDFAHLEIDKSHREWHTDLKLSEMMKE